MPRHFSRKYYHGRVKVGSRAVTFVRWGKEKHQLYTESSQGKESTAASCCGGVQYMSAKWVSVFVLSESAGSLRCVMEWCGRCLGPICCRSLMLLAAFS